MDNAEYVETSDPEEFEISRRNAPIAWPSWPIVPAPARHTNSMPRKRRKLSHGEINTDQQSISGAERPSSQDSTIVHSSSVVPTSTVVSDEEQDCEDNLLRKESYDVFEAGERGSELDRALQRPINCGGRDPKGLYSEMPIDGSQDELDVISQPFSEMIVRPADSASATDVFAPQPLPYPDEDPSAEVTESTQRHEAIVDPSSLFGQKDADVHALELTNRTPSPVVSSYTPEMSPVGQARLLSLSPSSPPRPSTSLVNSPQRSQSISSAHSISFSSRSYGTANFGRQEAPPNGEEHALLTPDDLDGLASRRYSLRTRQARQLKPYEYDKYIYKQQMRRMPDAIVKVVSPERRGRSYRHRETREDDEFVVGDDEDEQTQKERRRHIAPMVAEGDSLAWLPDVFQMSDDDDVQPLSPLAERTSSRPASVALPGNLEARRGRLHEFPLKGSRLPEFVDRTGEGNEAEANQKHLAITYQRRKDIRERVLMRDVFTSRKPTNAHRNALLDSATPVSQREEPEQPRSSYERDDADLDYDGPDQDPSSWSLAERLTISRDQSYGETSNSRSEESEIDDHNDTPAMTRSDVVDGDENEFLSRLSKRQKRALKRMFPTVLIKDLAKKVSSGTDRPHRKSSGGAATSDDDETALAPGRSKTTKRCNKITQEIRGDPESSEPESDVDVIKQPAMSVINVDSSSDSDSSTGDVSEDGSDGLLVESITDAGYFDQDFSRQALRRTEAPLFDMMLSRTRRDLGKKTPRKRILGGSSKDRVHNLKADGLDINIRKSSGVPRSHMKQTQSRQTRIRFASPRSLIEGQLDENGIDLTGLDSDVEDHVAHAQHQEVQRRFTKRQRREAVQRSGLYTFVDKAKKIWSGRKKGFTTVQIDIADNGLRNAIKPLHSGGTSQLRSSNGSHLLATEESSRRPSHRSRDTTQTTGFKQTKLHDFGYNDAYASDTMEYAAGRLDSTYEKSSSDLGNENRVSICTLDAGISVPTSGLGFPAESYLGKQLLANLLKFAFDGAAMLEPNRYEGINGIVLDAEMTCNQFVDAIHKSRDAIHTWLDQDPTVLSADDKTGLYERLMQAICQFVPWLYAKADNDGKSIIQSAVSSQVDQFTQRLRQKAEMQDALLGLKQLATLWFYVELPTVLLAAARQESYDLVSASWREAILLLVKTLISFGIEKALRPIAECNMAIMTVPLKAAEIWVCLIHLLPQVHRLHATLVDSKDGFWPIVLQATKEERNPTLSNIEVSENLWRLVFGLCALSHFSSHGTATVTPRLPPRWDIVGSALDVIRLTRDKEQDSMVSRETLKRRDRYVRMMVARCFILGTKWNWPLRDALAMFKKLDKIFKTRNFGNLYGEKPEFPAFIRYHRVDFLNDLRASDTAFSLYLKLVMQVNKAELSSDAKMKTRMDSFLRLVMPLTGVAFSKTRPPTTEELSMLINRFSAVITAILSDGKENPKIQNRIVQARRYVTFADADARSRNICILAAMYISVAISHLSLELKEPLKWLEDMCEVLLAEFDIAVKEQKDGNKSDVTRRLRQVVLNLHDILISVTNILRFPNMKTETPTPEYPDISLIRGSWVKKLFPLRALTNIVSTRFLVLNLVKSFLVARDKVIPRRRLLRPAASDDDPESQDMFAEFAIYDDLYANMPMGGEVEGTSRKDNEAAEVMDVDIIPAIYRLLLQCVNDPTASPSDENNVDDWVDCWAACAAIVVRNEKRTWDHFLQMSDRTWGLINDFMSRRRIAVRFMDQILRQDPTAYGKVYEKYFIGECLNCLVAYRITTEHEYLSTLFSLDGLRHPLLRGIPVEITPGEVNLSRTDVLQIRGEIISCVFSNLDSVLLSDISEYNKNIFIECVLSMLVAMQMTLDSLKEIEEQNKYGELCRHVFWGIRKYNRIHSLKRLSTVIAWGDHKFSEPLVA